MEVEPGKPERLHCSVFATGAVDRRDASIRIGGNGQILPGKTGLKSVGVIRSLLGQRQVLPVDSEAVRRAAFMVP